VECCSLTSFDVPKSVEQIRHLEQLEVGFVHDLKNVSDRELAKLRKKLRLMEIANTCIFRIEVSDIPERSWATDVGANLATIPVVMIGMKQICRDRRVQRAASHDWNEAKHSMTALFESKPMMNDSAMIRVFRSSTACQLKRFPPFTSGLMESTAGKMQCSRHFHSHSSESINSARRTFKTQLISWRLFKTEGRQKRSQQTRVP
jgi:hypothetical protein